MLTLSEQDWNLMPGLHKDRKHVLSSPFLSLSHVLWSSHICNDGRYSYSQEIFAIDMLKTLKPSLVHDHKHI